MHGIGSKIKILTNEARYLNKVKVQTDVIINKNEELELNEQEKTSSNESKDREKKSSYNKDFTYYW